MNCERIREIIITDYADGTVSGADAGLIKEHLASCRACREFEALVQSSAIAPFRRLAREDVPPGIWDAIREQLPEPAPERAFFLRAAVSRLFFIPRPALLALSSVSICVAAALLIYFHLSPPGASGGYIVTVQDEKMQYMAYIMGFSDTMSDRNKGEYTYIEEMFFE
ncbi:MAG: zf-HC2 domain-containing protein [Candidatus Omnitrophota bacterium]|jgi:hypothetical protein